MGEDATTVVLHKVKLELDRLPSDIRGSLVYLQGGTGQITYHSDIKHCMVDTLGKAAPELIEAAINEIGEAVNLRHSEKNTIIKAVLGSMQYATTHTTIGRDEKLAGYYVKIISQWNKDMTSLCFVASYFKVDHHLGWVRHLKGYHADALRAIEKVCQFNATTAMAIELQKHFSDNGIVVPSHAYETITL